MADSDSCTEIPAPIPTTPTKDQLRIDLMDFTEPDDEDHRVPFFGRRRSEHTWVVSFFVFVNLITFISTMIVNDCPNNSNGLCVLQPLGCVSFQPLLENPLLGPSWSTLVKMGALQRLAVQQGKMWHLVVSPWLHAGVIHLLVNLSSIILVGHRLEQEFGPLRAAIIYLCSALVGGVTSAIFVEQIPAVGASGALFGLLGAMLAGLFRNWKIYATKFSALVMLGFFAVINLCIGLLPLVDNFSSIGGFLSGILLGLGLLFNPQLSMMERNKGIFDYDLNRSVKLKQKLDKPIPRIIALLLFSMILVGGLAAVLRGINANEHCHWCHYLNCVPTKMWSCNERAPACEATLSDGRLTLTCMAEDKFHTYPFAKISKERMDDLCSLICS